MKLRILLIEDNALNVELATDLLVVRGFQVAHAVTAEEGLRLAAQTLPDLILMDLSLPGMDGLVATKALKANPATSRIPVIALTAHAMRGDQEIAFEAGCDGYLAKPIDVRSFALKVFEFIAAANPSRNEQQT